MKKDMVKLGITLALFASLACASLAVVYSFTKESIEKQSEMQLTASLKEVFPEARPAPPRSRMFGAWSMESRPSGSLSSPPRPA